MPTVRLLPAREFPLDEAGAHALPQPLPRGVRGRPVAVAAVQGRVSNGIAPAGIEYYLPLFFDATATLFDYLPPNDRRRACTATCAAAIARFWQDTESRYRLLRGDRDRPLLPPRELFLPVDEFIGVLKPFARIELPTWMARRDDARDATRRTETPHRCRCDESQVDRRADDPLRALKRLRDRHAASAC